MAIRALLCFHMNFRILSPVKNVIGILMRTQVSFLLAFGSMGTLIKCFPICEPSKCFHFVCACLVQFL